MRTIEVTSPHGDYKTVLGYVLEHEDDILIVIDKESCAAGLNCYTPQYILDNELREYGERPTTFPAIVVIETNEEYNVMEARYITKEMFGI